MPPESGAAPDPVVVTEIEGRKIVGSGNAQSSKSENPTSQVAAAASANEGDRCFLYRHFDKEGRLLYVGISLNALNRLAQHKGVSPWFWKIATVRVDAFPNRDAALVAEREAIQKEKPFYNLKRRRERSPDLAEESRLYVLRRFVAFNPTYRINDAARALDVRPIDLQRLIDAGKIGFVRIGDKKQTGGDIRITGWQLIEFLEAAEARRPAKNGGAA
jgi:hypothetical protein